MDASFTIAPHVDERAAVPYAFVRRVVTMATIGAVADRIPVIIGWLADRGVPPGGAPFLRYRQMDTAGRLVVEGGVPLGEPVPGAGEIETAELPAGRYATLTHRGHPDALVDATSTLLSWVAEQGHRFDTTPDPDGDLWGCRLEIFHTHPAEVPIDAWVTELAFRLAD
jgi:effector-binding domain-containing protein